ncbi:uncharacterized protein LOC101240673 isoform X2 [Hydra vulgaris]|uniref:uncharacterized protein LOC101240673 isoform X2 n=1 Tax=Hydra vulgaris TaxID=6087 RepID=UPI001F5FA6DE|nr:uncharacterized protein LOC101240673 isoform X2 [Hydra vulgaris]
MVEKTPFQPVEDWLRSLGLLHYAQSFYDNGYEDIDTCKLIKNADLDVINVKSERDRNDILSAVAKMNQNLYFELEQNPTEIERVKLEKVLLKSKLKECLILHNIQLIEPPYFNPDGTLGDLYTLAIRLADELETYFEDVLEALEVLRKRQLPVQSYNQINEIPDTVVQKDALSVHDPAEYLDVETHKKNRTLSASKYDPRITKSTTDLNFENHQNAASKLKGKSQKQRSFINIFKRHKDEINKKNEQRKSTFEFNATDITLSQNEIKNLFEKVKTKQITQEDALETVQKRGLSKSLSGEGTEHNILIDSSPPSETGSLNKIKKGKMSKSMIKKPSSLFYTDDTAANNELLVVKLQDRRASIAGDMVCSAKNSPDLSRHGLFKIIRSSIRKKSKSSDGSSFDKDEQLSPSEETDLMSNNFINKEDIGQPQYVDLQTVKSIVELEKKESRSVPPPPPPRLDLKLNQVKDRSESNISNKSCPADLFSENTDDNIKNEKVNASTFKESHSSLKIKSFTKYQDDISKQKLIENKENLVLTSKDENHSLKSKAGDLCLKNLDNSPLNTVKPSVAPRRPERRIPSSESVPVAPPRRQKVVNITSPISEEKNFDDIGKEMSRLIEDLNDDLTYLDNGSTSMKSGSNSNNSASSNSPDSRTPVTDSRDCRINSSTNLNNVTFYSNNRNLNNFKVTNEEEEIKPPQKPSVLPKRFTSSIQNNVVTSSNTESKELIRKSNSQSSIESLANSCGLKTLEYNSKINETAVKNTEKIVEQKKLRTSLNQILEKKLRKEEIKLNEYPYTGSDGSWIVPFALIKRYSEELQHSVEDIAVLFDAIRTEKRTSKKLPVIPLDIKNLRNDANISKKMSLQEWLVHIGLPMFTSDLADAGIESISEVSEMSIEDLKQVSVCDEKHMLLLIKEAKNF